jgi:hypothetical protein
MISKNGNIYLLRKKVISDVGRPASKYVMGTSHTHFRPTSYNPVLTREDTVSNRVEIENTKSQQVYNDEDSP